MISKDTFVKTMRDLQNLDEKMNVVDNALRALNRDFCGFYLPEIFDTTLHLLAEAMNDNEDWIYYFVYERNWLRDYKLGDITVHGAKVDIKNWEDVYDFIIGGND